MQNTPAESQSPRPQSPTVFIYKALISTVLIHSEYWMLPAYSLGELRSAVQAKLFYLPNDWSTRPTLTQEDIERAALEKMLRTFALREPANVSNGEAMDRLFFEKFADISNLQIGPYHKRYACSAGLQADGNVLWGYDHEGDGKYFGNLSVDITGTDLRLDDYLLAQMKRDLFRYIE